MTAELKKFGSQDRPSKDEVESTYRQRYQMVDANIRDFEKMKIHANVVHDDVR